MCNEEFVKKLPIKTIVSNLTEIYSTDVDYEHVKKVEDIIADLISKNDIDVDSFVTETVENLLGSDLNVLDNALDNLNILEDVVEKATQKNTTREKLRLLGSDDE
jgi:hypothetical protein